MATIISRNPATGETIKELEMTPVTALPEMFARAKAAQEKWAALPVKKRASYLLQLRELLIHQVDPIAELISKENGKPRFEAMTNELLPCVDMLTFFAKAAPKALKDREIPMVLMKHRKSYLNYWPMGVVAVISPWNYPFLLPFGEIIMALVTGNAVIFKPSEVTPLCGLKIQELCEEAGLPHDLLQVVIGDGPVGAAIIQHKPAKVFFTGSGATGKKIMSAAGENLIPVNLELGGKNAMIVLSDADLDHATSAVLWGGFSNLGQICASVERLFVHESIAEHFTELLKAKIAQLKRGSDLGVVTFEKQKDVYDRHLSQAREAGAKIHVGGAFSEDRRFFPPTLVTSQNIESLDLYNQETFGPVISISTFKSVADAVKRSNASKYGLVAGVFTRNLALGEEIARQLEVGTVTINEITYTAGLGETPWGGVKESGIGRSHSELGLYEFLNVRHIHKPRSRLFIFKSMWWFPYTPFQYAMFREFFKLYSRSWSEKAKAFPHFIWNFVQFVKKEKRL